VKSEEVKVKSKERNTLIRSVLLFSLFFFHFSFVCFAENEFSLRLAPVFETPLNLPQLGTGIGANASLDWAFLQFTKKFDFGVSAGGGFSSISVQTGDPLILLEGRAGPFLRWRPFDRWAFQAGPYIGFYNHSRGGENGTAGLFGGTLGAQFHLSPYFSLFADGGYTWRVYSPDRPLPTLNAALGIRINLSEIMGGRARVQVERTEQYRVFPVSWAWYENNPVATVKITNEEPNAITEINLSFFMDSYMGQPWNFAALSRLAPGESVEIPLTALFNEIMINLSDDVNAVGIIQMQYRSLGTKKENTFAIQMPIHNRNALNWDDDRRAAAFVSPRDSSALHFARYVAGVAVDSNAVSSNVALSNTAPPNVRIAAAMFEALRLYGIHYVVDPASAYASLSEDASGLDSLNYPYQTLHYRSGDCDDLSILFCSLLEVVGIETAFITIPGHIYMAFEVGDSNWRRGNTNIIERDGNDGIRRRWLPVEITVPDQGFNNAWRIGVREWRSGGEEAALYPIRSAWEVYPSVTVPASGNRLPEVPEQTAVARAMGAELSADKLAWLNTPANLAAEREQQRLRAEKLARQSAETEARRIALAEEVNALFEQGGIANVTATVTNQGVMISLSDIQFQANSAELSESEKPKLQEIAGILKGIPGARIHVAGHTALAGTAEGRFATSRQRAQAVATYLVSLHAVNINNVTVTGYGADRPIADNATAAGMAANRRVEITILEN
jgi:outer membrane protein OmpA-like peptidoglycan-associated protein